jgi:hypothetical protein
MTAKVTFFPVGNADTTRLVLANGRKLLIDFANMRNPKDPYDKRIDLAAELRRDLDDADRDFYDAVCFTHLDDDHAKGSADFFWFRHAACYQGESRIKINEL